MIAVIFEAQPNIGQTSAYFDTADALRTQLERIEGFITIERFESVTQRGKFLSLSFWRDEQSIAQWRNLPEHRRAQQSGRQKVFFDYRLRVANVIRDYGLTDRDQVPPDSRNAAAS